MVLESSAADIALELLDDELLLGDDRFYQVTDRDHPTHPTLLHYRQMSNTFFRHQGHAFLDVAIGLGIYYTSGHYFSDLSGRRRTTLQNNFSCVIPLRDNTHQLRAFHY